MFLFQLHQSEKLAYYCTKLQTAGETSACKYTNLYACIPLMVGWGWDIGGWDTRGLLLSELAY